MKKSQLQELLRHITHRILSEISNKDINAPVAIEVEEALNSLHGDPTQSNESPMADPSAAPEAVTDLALQAKIKKEKEVARRQALEQQRLLIKSEEEKKKAQDAETKQLKKKIPDDKEVLKRLQHPVV